MHDLEDRVIEIDGEIATGCASKRQLARLQRERDAVQRKLDCEVYPVVCPKESVLAQAAEVQSQLAALVARYEAE